MNSDALILALAERLGLIVAGAFLLLTITPIHKMRLRQGPSWRSTLLQILFFGAAGILGTYGGNLVSQSVANLRAMAVITGGLFGGPVVGIASGLIAGGHRILIDIGGFSAVPCGMATMIEGAAAGLLTLYLKERSVDWRWAAGLAMGGETLHMGMVLALSHSFTEAVELVRIIAAPMILLNALGAATFVQVINVVFRYRARQDSVQAQEILDIANSTVSHLRSGLTAESAMATARIIHSRVAVGAVAITSEADVLAHIGVGDDHHLPGRPIVTEATRTVLETGQPMFLNNKAGIGCGHPDCPFASAIIVPLTKGGGVVGTLKFYGTASKSLDLVLFELAKGLGNLFSTQLELENIQITERMLAHAEIRRLQAQINPHFLFNSLNTIISFCRTSPEKARSLLQDLSSYLRKSLEASRGFVPLSEELDQIRCYLAIEQARFGERIRIDFDVQDGCESWPIPPLIIQPLVENSVRHGILAHENGGKIRVQVRKQDGHLHVEVKDDGVGMDQNQVDRLFAKTRLDSRSGGIGVRNCFQRLEQIFGPAYLPSVVSAPGQGTRIDFMLPMPARV
ncbi:histidine kinase [Desulfomicrobium sp. ZS1]|jgi:two-component system sensor histidine kinase LytS|uniref:LytS/YhcK type 5TM receptor domain-containing protein n=1 Tax=Desulfomicrobium sp. ZS1 TaxID=2952228 RepID=UPI0020B40E71|nr:LytS/YhcK type 5TM receptor domain-containing protein [Desulfomicrobium sp. ZS1]UTF50475.1 histidine kinase [Desulfomicrobium sp. ZS1]